MNSARKLGLLKSSSRLLVNQLRKIRCSPCNRAAGVVLRPARDQKEKSNKALCNLEAGGSTAGVEGIQLVYQLTQNTLKKKEGIIEVIIATDGDFNVGLVQIKTCRKWSEEVNVNLVYFSLF